MKKMVAGIMTVVFTGMVMFTGCSPKITLLPGEVVAHAMEVNNDSKAYYAEAKMMLYENRQLTESSEIKEWHQGLNKARFETKSIGNGFATATASATAAKDNNKETETIITNDGKKMIVYNKTEKNAIEINVEQNPMSGKNSLKDQFTNTINMIKKTHDITIAGEEKVCGFDTYHMIGKPKQTDSLLGEMNFWVDKESWFVVKTVSESANTKMEMEYTKLDFSPKIDDRLFVQDIPKNIKIQNSEDQSKEKAITLDEGAKFIGKPILHCTNESEFTIKNVKLMEYSSKLAVDEVIQYYEKNKLEVFYLSARKAQIKENEDNLKIPGEKDATIRGQKGYTMEEGIKLLVWSEKGVDYTLMINDPKISIDCAIEIVEKMIFTK